MSFNYPVKPTAEDKKHYSDFIKSLQHVLPCRHCRENLVNNFKVFPLKPCHMESRANFSRYVYGLHETVNKMLGKKSGLKFCDVRERMSILGQGVLMTNQRFGTLRSWRNGRRK